MNEIDRRDFLKKLGIGAGALALGTSIFSLSACSKDDQDQASASNSSFAAIRVSSDIYVTDKLQRLAFAVFQNEKHVSEETLVVTLKKPDGTKINIKDVKPRNEGLKTQGIYSLESVFDAPGAYEILSVYNKNKISLAFVVEDKNQAPALGSDCLATLSPTNADPKDAQILCTRFEGECGLHQHSIADLLALKEPMIVLFATPARCQTSYCGPVLDLLRDEISRNPINACHIEIYKDETSPTTLDAVSEWGLPSEPWLFAIDKNGKIVKRLDGAFDLSEIKECISAARL